MATPPDDLEEKVDLVLENMRLREELGQYEISQKLLESKVSELEAGIKKYQLEKYPPLEEEKKRLREETGEWLKKWSNDMPQAYYRDKCNNREKFVDSINYILSIYKGEALREVIDYIRQVKNERGEFNVYEFISELKNKTVADILNELKRNDIHDILENNVRPFGRGLRSLVDQYVNKISKK